MQPRFKQLEERLRQSGVWPHRARRIIQEWSDHADDLSSGSSETDASRALGEDDILVQSVLDDPANLSWGWRYPWAVFGLFPAIGVVAISFLIVVVSGFSVFGLKSVMLDLGHEAMIVPPWLSGGIGLWTGFWELWFPAVWAAFCVALATYLRQPSIWLYPGLLVVAAFVAVYDFSIEVPSTFGGQGNVAVGLGCCTYDIPVAILNTLSQPESWLRATPIFLIMATFEIWRRHQRPVS